jgi:hypothetical protein
VRGRGEHELFAAAFTLSAMNPNQMKRFTTRREPVMFQIDDDTFLCVREIPAGGLIDLLKLQQELSGTTDRVRQLDVIVQLMQEMLVPDAFAKFELRLRDRDNPIGLRLLVDVMKWLLGEYGLRPTQSPDSSTDTSQETAGTGSTDGPPPEESTPETSPGTDSST